MNFFFTFLVVSFDTLTCLILIKSSLLLVISVSFKTSLRNPVSHGFTPVSDSFISLLYFNLIFVYDLR